MATTNNNPYPPPGFKQYYGGQQPPQQPYPGANYPHSQQTYPDAVPLQTYPTYGPPPAAHGNFQTHFPEDPEVKGFDFSDKSIRRGFIRKVYSILMVQLLITGAVISLFLFYDDARIFVQKNSWLIWLAFVVLFVSMIALACCGELRRKSPANYILLTLFTLAESFMLAVSASLYSVDEVLIAVGITAAICLGLTLFAFQTKWDFTMCGGILFVCVLIFFLFGIIASIFAATGHSNKIVSIVFASLGALLFSVYLVFDTQMMMGGKHKYSISPEEYIFAALNLYVDIINIFIYILALIGLSRD